MWLETQGRDAWLRPAIAGGPGIWAGEWPQRPCIHIPRCCWRSAHATIANPHAMLQPWHVLFSGGFVEGPGQHELGLEHRPLGSMMP